MSEQELPDVRFGSGDFCCRHRPQDWLPEKSQRLARFIAELVPGLDLSKIYGHYGRRDGRGKAAYHPIMMVRLLLYGYCVGVVSSRRMEHASYGDIAFRYLCADQHPDHDTISEFRRLHLPVLAQLFTQVLQLCDKAGLVKLGHVAIDGSKFQANASKHKAMSYNRMEEKEKQLSGRKWKSCWRRRKLNRCRRGRSVWQRKSGRRSDRRNGAERESSEEDRRGQSRAGTGGAGACLGG